MSDRFNLLHGYRFPILLPADDSEDSEFAQSLADNGGEVVPFRCLRQGHPFNDGFDPLHQSLIGALLTGSVDIVVLQTAIGTLKLFDSVRQSTDLGRFIANLDDTILVGASKPTIADLGSHGLNPIGPFPPPGDWRCGLAWLEQTTELSGKRIWLEWTAMGAGLLAGLESRGAKVTVIEPFSAMLKNIAAAESLLQSLAGKTCDPNALVVMISDIRSAVAYCELAAGFPQVPLTDQLREHHIVISGNRRLTDLLTQNGIAVDATGKETDSYWSPTTLASALQRITQRHLKTAIHMSGPASAANDRRAPWYDSPFMKACRLETTSVTPVWMMRQAGRYMKEYRDVRARFSFLDMCANPQVCSEIMCTAVNRLGVDVAIIFSDLLPILVPMGCDLEFVAGDGPKIHNPIRSSADVDRIKPLETLDELQFVMDTVTQTRNDLPADIPLIGFAGAPFTLASYMIEGGSSRNYAHAKTLMHTDTVAWRTLMQRLSDSIVLYLTGQIDAGAQCVQLFDSWAGCLSTEDYRVHVHPFVKQIIERLPPEVPVINFATGNPALLPLLADTKATVIGVDWRIGLADAWKTIGYDRAVQGNIDPTILLTDVPTIRKHVTHVLDQAAGRPGHIFNLGHGILPQTPVDNAIALVDAVHELSQR